MKVIVLTAAWCVPCKKYKPTVTEVCHKHGVDVQFVDVESQEGAILQKDLRVSSVPTTVIKNGDMIMESFSGALSKYDLEYKIEKYMVSK